MKRVILVFTVMLICMMASSAFSTEARPYDPMRPRVSPGGDDYPWDTPKVVAQDNKYFGGGGGFIGPVYNEDCVFIIIGSHSMIFQQKLDCIKQHDARKITNRRNSESVGKK